MYVPIVPEDINGKTVVYDGSIEEFNALEAQRKESSDTEGVQIYKKKKITVKSTNTKNSISRISALSNNFEDFTSLVKPAYIDGINRPRLTDEGKTENVSAFDGSLQLKYTDLSLPGRNGLDLELKRVFQSRHLGTDFYTIGDDIYADITTYYNKRFALGLGWSFGFPSVEVNRTSDGYAQAIYHDGEGNAYRSNYNDTIRNENGDATYNGYYIYHSNLDNYPGDNVRFKEKDRSYQRGDYRSYYSFTDENNIKEYFSKTGELLAITDSFGNEITFDYQYLAGENLIPFSSYSDSSLGDFRIGTGFEIVGSNEHISFDGGANGKEGTLRSYAVAIDENYESYYASLVYEVPDGITSFNGSFSFYCDIYDSENNLLESYLIGNVVPTETKKVIRVGNSFSFDANDFVETPAKAKLRLEVSGEEEILFDDFRISPKNPMISSITDTIGRKIE